jgi:hypothetical protein
VKLVVTARRKLDCLRETDKGKYAYVCVCWFERILPRSRTKHACTLVRLLVIPHTVTTRKLPCHKTPTLRQ